MSAYRGLFGRAARKRCPHSGLQPIYGDQINHVGGWRLWCRDCRRFLDGPVALASSRAGESRHSCGQCGTQWTGDITTCPTCQDATSEPTS